MLFVANPPLLHPTLPPARMPQAPPTLPTPVISPCPTCHTPSHPPSPTPCPPEGPPTDAAASPKGEAYPREVRKCLKSPSHTTSRLHEAFSVPLPGPSRRALEPYMREGVLDAEAIAAAGGAACSKLLAGEGLGWWVGVKVVHVL